MCRIQLISILWLTYGCVSAEYEKVCTTEYQPQCGSDGPNYWNEFIASQNPVKITLQDGPCPYEDPKHWCNLMICTGTFQAVCSSSGFLYPNHCQFDHAQCLNRKMPSTPGFFSVNDLKRIVTASFVLLHTNLFAEVTTLRISMIAFSDMLIVGKKKK